jgi:hypothetical protein
LRDFVLTFANPRISIMQSVDPAAPPTTVTDPTLLQTMASLASAVTGRARAPVIPSEQDKAPFLSNAKLPPPASLLDPPSSTPARGLVSSGDPTQTMKRKQADDSSLLSPVAWSSTLPAAGDTPLSPPGKKKQRVSTLPPPPTSVMTTESSSLPLSSSMHPSPTAAAIRHGKTKLADLAASTSLRLSRMSDFIGPTTNFAVLAYMQVSIPSLPRMRGGAAVDFFF